MISELSSHKHMKSTWKVIRWRRENILHKYKQAGLGVVQESVKAPWTASQWLLLSFQRQEEAARQVR